MKHINDLVFTSVQDAKSTLECTLSQSPQQALNDAEAVLKAMVAFQYDQPSRRKMLKTIINKANKVLKAQQGER
jgi:DNA-binding MltR family transcriptional regulator